MEVRNGYKQTEVGVIPKAWRVEPIEQISTVGRGRVISHREIARSRNPRYPVYSSQTSNDGVMGYLDIFEFEGEYITWTTDGANAGTVFARTGRFNCTNVCGTIKLKSDNHLFVAKVLGTIAPRHVSRHLGNPKLMNDVMKRVKIPLPPTKAEQEAIAEALSDADALIKSLEQLLAKKRHLKQGTMQELLTGRKRLPGFSGEWEVKRLGDVAAMGSGGTPPSSVPDYYDGHIPWVSISDMTKGGKVIVSTDRNLTHAGFANSAAQLFPMGTVLYAMYASLGECSIAGIELCSSQAILGIRPSGSLNDEFLYYRLTLLKPIVKSMGQQGTQANLNKGMVQDFRFLFPRLPEQIAIAELLSDMDVEIAELEAKLAKARQLKQGMMQELLTGRIRLV
jgi:type I restriction enzyme, S subunit